MMKNNNYIVVVIILMILFPGAIVKNEYIPVTEPVHSKWEKQIDSNRIILNKVLDSTNKIIDEKILHNHP